MTADATNGTAHPGRTSDENPGRTAGPARAPAPIAGPGAAPGDDPQLTALVPDPRVTAAMRRPGLPLAHIIDTVMTGYADRPALGERAREHVTDPATGRTVARLLPAFTTLTYGELWRRAGALAAAWHADGLRPGDFVAVLGFPGVDYMVVDLACAWLGAVCVPLPTGEAPDRVAPLLAETGPRVLAAGLDQLETALAVAPASPVLGSLIVFDHDPADDAQRDRLATLAAGRPAAGTATPAPAPLAAEIDRGAALPAAPLCDAEPTDEHLSVLIYTSGSTGTPKGAMYTHRVIANLWQNGPLPRDPAHPVVTLNFLPLSHIAGRGTLVPALANGGTGHFTAAPDMSTLFEDAALVRPTELWLVPRIIDMLCHSLALDDTPAGPDRRHRYLGDRLTWICNVAAPVSPQLAAVVEELSGLPLHDGYGSTELSLVLLDGHPIEPNVTDCKLADVPELGYATSDRPHPRGELLVRTRVRIPGYHRRPELTAEVFDADGYYRTGDIMADTGPGGFVYVDRAKNVLKLSQGEFVALSKVEAALAASPLVRQLFVYGNSKRPYLLAVVVPDAEVAGPDAGADPAALREAVLASFRELGAEAGLKPVEIPRDVLIETEPFSIANGLLSGVRKPLRPKLTERYAPDLEAIYTALDEEEDRRRRTVREAAGREPVLTTVLNAVAATLGTDSGLTPDARFTDLGGDSLTALTLARLLSDAFETDVPVDVVISPANTLRRVAERVETARAPGNARPDFAAVHGAGATVARAADLRLDRFIDPAVLAGATGLPGAAAAAPAAGETVLLTGANGYLGRFLCLAWLERLAARGGTLVCLIRGTDAPSARARLEEAFSADPEVLARFRALADRHLTVVPGDVGDPRLGLTAAAWDRLSDSVDRIVHSAALVNHVLPYDQLFAPNVLGTAELISLALTTRLKPITFLSTVTVLMRDTTDPAEATDIRHTSPARTLDTGYANGYATSKWAGEVLLREAHEAYGLPVTVVRASMLLAHRALPGQLNLPDMFTRLLISILTTGLAPESFYATTPGGPRPHYDGLPVDFSAEAITALGERGRTGFHTFNALNAHDDGVSLDTIVDWLIEDGHRITRVPDYGDWYVRFAQAHQALPERQRQSSALPLLAAYQDPTTPGAMSLPTEEFCAAVRASETASDREVPHLSRDLMRKYVRDLRALAVI